MSMDEEEKYSYRRKRWGQIMRHACGEYLDDNQILFKDLRHSYVIFLLGHGYTVEQCAMFIGDSIEVAKKHYAGFVVADTNMAQLAKQMAGLQL